MSNSNSDGARLGDEVLHIDPNRGLWIPPEMRHVRRGVVFRTPSGTIQHYSSQDLDPYYGMIRPKHFGDEEELRDARNGHLAPNRVSIKHFGDDPVVYEVDMSGETVS